MNRFLKGQILIGLNVLFFVIIFNTISNIYLSFKDSSILKNIDEDQAAKIREVVKEELDAPVISRKLKRSFVFFYTDDYTKRTVFTTQEGSKVGLKTQNISEDPFFQRMLPYHFNDICFVIETPNINKTSPVYPLFVERNEVGPQIYYVACPILIKNTLVGYIGGINNNLDGSISIETMVVKNTASNIERVLLNN